MNKLVFVLDKLTEIRESLERDDVPDDVYENVEGLLSEIEEAVGEVRDDGEFEDFTIGEEE